MVRIAAINHGLRSYSARTVELSTKVSSVPRARHVVAEDLGNKGIPISVIENVLIVVTELVTNAIRHARPVSLGEVRSGVVLAWTVVGHDVLIDVSDGGGHQRPHVRRPSCAEDDGRGLAIVDAVAREWDIRAERDRVTVHAVVGPRNPGGV